MLQSYADAAPEMRSLAVCRVSASSRSSGAGGTSSARQWLVTASNAMTVIEMWFIMKPGALYSV
jgi:hypothetical protein